MTLTETTAPNQTDAISFEAELAHPPAKVWRAITNPELVAKWLLPVVGPSLELGARFQLKAQPQPGWAGVVDCRVLELETERRLRYAWVVGDIDTVVTLTLAPTASGTKLTVVQSGFKPEQKQNFGGARYGWKIMGEKLVGVLASLETP